MQALSKDRVLLVDDEPQVLVALEDLLSDKFDVFKTQSGEDALDLMQRHHDIAVLITDQRMPKMSGDELLARLGDSSGARRILVTGFADLSAVIRAVNDGKIFAYVTKPWNPDDLLHKVDKAAEHFRLANELSYERKLLHDLMDNIPDGIYFKDLDLRFLRVNRAFSALYAVEGESPGEDQLVGRRLRDLEPTPENEAIEAAERRILAQGQAALGVVREHRVGRERRWLSETKSPIVSPSGEIPGLVGICRDVTEQRRLEQQLVQSQKMEAIGQLAGGVAHDFNNLLSVITSYGGLLLSEIPEPDPKRDDLKQLLEAARRAADLTRQLLTFSRQSVAKPSVLDLNAVVTNVERMLRRVIGEQIELVTRLDPELSGVEADAGQIEQVLMNLSVNARDAMPSGGKLTIETSNAVIDAPQSRAEPGAVPGRFVALSVSDTGMGMDAETQTHIFEPFFTTKEVGKGTGLGLSTVYGIVRQSGGHVWVTSEPGQGATFKVYLPAVDEPKPAQAAERTGATRTMSHAKVLLVEDDDAVRVVAVRILRQAGYEVFEAKRVADARAICGERGPELALLLTDVIMPELTGPELADELRQAHPHLRVLYMSGYAGAAVVRSGNLNPDLLLEKPFAPDVLTEKVHAVLNAPR